MKIIKRNGSEVSFDRGKIFTAIMKANVAADTARELTEDQIGIISRNVENQITKLGRVLVPVKQNCNTSIQNN